MGVEQDGKLFEIILNSVADGVFTVDAERCITSFNRSAERITGVPAAKAVGRPCSSVFHADICEHGCALLKTLQTGRECIDVPARILNHRACPVPISVSTAVLRDADGTVLGGVETFRDLSAIEQLRREIKLQYTFEDIVAKSKAFRRIFAILPDVAESDTTVLIEGSSGSGKELVARAVHNLSRRRDGPFVPVNCGALPSNLFESELFGYAQGAFTDAKRDKPGRLARARGGTLFLDEVSELPPATQVKLLRVLQEREYEPLGGDKTLKADVRVVAATNQRLADLVSEGRFRDDLYFRLAVVRLNIPPLSERREDIPYLVDHFIERFNAKRGRQIGGVTPAVLETLMRHDFSGNVRELENVIEYAFVLCHNRVIDVNHLPEELQPRKARGGSERRDTKRLKQAEAEAIRVALRARRGVLGATARELGVSRTTLWRKMAAYGLSASEFRGD
jgi:PAS domain S-box-containing protein